MTKEKFLSLLTLPNEISTDLIPELKEMTEQYPYFAPAHLLLAKAMHENNDLQQSFYLKKAHLYAGNSKQLYFLLHPERAKLAEPQKFSRDNTRSGNYFEMIEKVEAVGGDAKQSLKSLAERLKAARQTIQHTPIKKEEQESPKVIRLATPDYFDNKTTYSTEQNKYTEEFAKKLIQDKKYSEALVILRELNLIYPKKSIYFADQIRFLEKILVNKKK